MLIYLVTNTVNGKKYVGRTSQSMERRWNKHLSCARRGSNFYLHLAIVKYGASSFTIEKVDEAETDDELNTLEIAWIKRLKTNVSDHGYNLTAGGEGMSGWRPTKETLEKLSAAHRGHKHSTDLHKAAVRAAHKGKPKSLEQRRKMAAHWDEDRREEQAEIARRVNATQNLVLKDYVCDLCQKMFTQVKKGVFGGHRKACMKKHGVLPPPPEPLWEV